MPGAGGPRQAAPAEGTERSPAQGLRLCGSRLCRCRGLVGKVLPLIRALGAGCGAARPGWGWGCGCLSPGWYPQLPRPPMCALQGAAADRSSVSLVTAGRRYSGKEAGRARKGRQVWGETALRGARASAAPYTESELPGRRMPGVRSVPRSPDRRNGGRLRPGLESAQKGCSARPGAIQPTPRSERSSHLRRFEIPPLPRG